VRRIVLVLIASVIASLGAGYTPSAQAQFPTEVVTNSTSPLPRIPTQLLPSATSLGTSQPPSNLNPTFFDFTPPGTLNPAHQNSVPSSLLAPPYQPSSSLLVYSTASQPSLFSASGGLTQLTAATNPSSAAVTGIPNNLSSVTWPTIIAGQFSVDNGNEASRGIGIAIESVGKYSSFAALSIGGSGSSSFNNGMLINADKITGSSINIYSPAQQKSLFQFNYIGLSDSASIETTAKVSIGSMFPSSLSNAQLLIHQGSSNLAFGESSDRKGAFSIMSINNSGSPLFAPLELNANGLYLPATSVIIGSPVDHSGENLQVTGRAWFNGNVFIFGTLSFSSREDILKSDLCRGSTDLNGEVIFSSGEFYACQRGVLNRFILEPVAKRPSS
jgi:hypothetical protein